MNGYFKLLLILAVAFALWTYWLKPEQGSRSLELYSPIENVQQVEGYTITSLEPYAGEFRVLARENYRMGREAELKQLSITQSNRWYYWRYENNPPIPLNDIASSSANTHLIPANKVVAQKLADIDVDDMVYLKGQLVEVKSTDGWTWRSSLSRTDTGNGACELMLVEEVREISSL